MAIDVAKRNEETFRNSGVPLANLPANLVHRKRQNTCTPARSLITGFMVNKEDYLISGETSDPILQCPPEKLKSATRMFFPRQARRVSQLEHLYSFQRIKRIKTTNKEFISLIVSVCICVTFIRFNNQHYRCNRLIIVQYSLIYYIRDRSGTISKLS